MDLRSRWRHLPCSNHRPHTLYMPCSARSQGLQLQGVSSCPTLRAEPLLQGRVLPGPTVPTRQAMAHCRPPQVGCPVLGQCLLRRSCVTARAMSVAARWWRQAGKTALGRSGPARAAWVASRAAPAEARLLCGPLASCATAQARSPGGLGGPGTGPRGPVPPVASSRQGSAGDEVLPALGRCRQARQCQRAACCILLRVQALTVC